MEFALTEEQELILKTVNQICEEKIAPNAKRLEEEPALLEENIKMLAEHDLMGVMIPQEYGGLGEGLLTWALVGERLSYYCTTTGAVYGANILCTWPIMAFGTKEQKERYLPSFAKGESIGAFALTEPEAGSDASAIRTVAKKGREEYILNGTKIFITNAGLAKFYIIIAKTAPEKGARGMSAFIVEKGTEGFLFGKEEKKMGYHALPNKELIFQDCRIPKENLLLAEGRGFYLTMQTLDIGRVGMAAGAVGLAQRAYEEALSYAKERVQFEHPISSFQAVQFMLADMATEIEAARLLFAKAAFLKDKGEGIQKYAAMAKLYASEVVKKVTDFALQIHGGYGYTKEYGVERYYREAKLFEIVEGTSQIQRQLIAQNLIKGR